MIKFCCSFTAVIIRPLSIFLQWQQEFNYIFFFFLPLNQRENDMSLPNKRSCDMTAIHVWDVIPECPSGSPPKRAEPFYGLSFPFDIKGEHKRGWRRWMSGGRIKVGDQTPSEGIGERVWGISNSLPRLLPSLFGWKLPRNLFKAKDGWRVKK